MNNTFLLDNEFLEKLNHEQQRELWVKILALTIDEEPVEEITGRITGGSISVDGSSKMRRSCSLTMLSTRMEVNEYIWGLNTKVKISVGMKNKISSKYDDIVWFPQGTYVLNSFSISVNNQNSTISLQGKDKMCLLNGDVGGNLTALSYAFDTVEEENGYNSYYKRKLTLRYIIREAVHTFANEPYHNIIINDLDDWGLELLTYRGEEPMYFIYNPIADDISNMTINPDQIYWFKMPSGARIEQSIKQLALRDDFEFKVLNDFVSQSGKSGTSVYTSETGTEEVKIIKIEYGMTCGYRITDLTYPKDLTLNVGEGVTSMLDKLVAMLGNFEYFYNLDGQFVFQKKPTFVNTSWNNLTNNGDEQWADSAAYTSSHIYSLYDSKLVSSFSNAPALNNVKNDFSIWGVRKGITGIEMPIHMRYAIDKKPEYYKSIDGKVYVTSRDVFGKLKEEAKINTLKEVNDRIQSFTLKENYSDGLTVPVKNTDGSWSAGWWNIKDWHDYYYALTLSEPNQTMKWYSKNNADGCVHAKSLNIEYDRNVNDDAYVWLLIKKGSNGKFNPQHGSGNPNSGAGRNCTLYESYIDSKGVVQTKKILDSNGNVIQKWFYQPYSGCDDKHTYLVFLKDDIEKQGNEVYFYNPEFPNYTSFDDLVQDQIEKEYQDYLEQGMLNLVDWREIIYQMAKDHNKYGNMDNANPKTQLVKVKNLKTKKYEIITRQQLNEYSDEDYDKEHVKDISLITAIRELNPDFYPTGYTGYEQYYIDIIGFWRQLYNPEYVCSYEIEPLTRLEYEAIQEDNLLFYDAPVYEQCSEHTIYYEDIDYYMLENDEYVQVMITKTEFNSNKERFYYIKNMEEKPVPIDRKPLEIGKTYYKTTNHSASVTVTSANIGTINPKEYSIRHEKIERVPLFKLDPFYPAYLFNQYNVNTGVYQPVTTGITEGDYSSRPWVYYRNKSGKQTCCTSINIPAPNGRAEDCWFENNAKPPVKIETYTKANCAYPLAWDYDDTVDLDKDTTNDLLKAICINATRGDVTLANQQTLMPWTYCYKVYTYEPLEKPAIPYDPHGTYYLKSDILEFNPKGSENEFWKYDLITNPESLIFWLDFLDTEGELDNYSVPRIGDRPKAVNDKDVKAIYFRETPGIIFLQPDEWANYTKPDGDLDKPTGYAYAQMPFYLQHLFAISSQGKSAKDVLDNYLYQYSYCTESITVQALPIYHLEPNTRILIRDDNSRINGEYIINKISIPLDSKGSMSINAVKAVDRLY